MQIPEIIVSINTDIKHIMEILKYILLNKASPSNQKKDTIIIVS